MKAPTRTKWVSLALLSAIIALAPMIVPGAQKRPNIVFVLMDDLRWDEADYPFVKAPGIQRLKREGVSFANAFVTTPLCSPSRASFFTGQYAHHHGIIDNTARDELSHKLVTFPKLLQDFGYRTAFVGKWHMGLDDTARPGFDYWVSVKGQGEYLDPEINENGQRKKLQGYVTDIFSDYALAFLKNAAPSNQPFLLCVSHKAVHPDLKQNADGSLSDPTAGKFIPAPRHAHLYENAPIPHRTNYAVVPEDKPALRRKVPGLPPLGPGTVTDDETIRNRLRMMTAADEGLVRILDALEKSGKLNDTLVVFTSDEGYFYGEHGLSVERRLAYEESARIPMLMRLPGLIKPGTSITEMVLNLDIAPTFLELGKTPVPSNLDGLSLLPLFREVHPPWRMSFMMETFSDKVFPRVTGMGYDALRTDRWKYIRYRDLSYMDELYDLKADPFEMHNLFNTAEGKIVVPELKPVLQRLQQP